MNQTRRSILSVFPFLGLAAVLPGCPGQTPAMVITEVEAGITDAQIAIQTIIAGIDAYFAAHPNPALQAKIDAAVADTSAALRVVTTALSGATGISDGNVQAALIAFASAYSALMSLIGQIGIQTASAATPKVAGVIYVQSPRILQVIKPKAAALAPAPAAK